MTLKPTRSELLKAKKRIKLAIRGHDLLKKKQDSLVLEFFKLLKEVRGKRQALQEAYVKASAIMNEARALESDLRITAAALAVQEHAPITVQVRNIAGVRVPEIQVTSGQGVTYPSLMLQDLGTSYRGVVDAALALAAKETALRKVLEEIRRTKRRTYALEHLFIPRLKADVQRVQLALEERAREEFVRLKRMKR